MYIEYSDIYIHIYSMHMCLYRTTVLIKSIQFCVRGHGREHVDVDVDMNTSSIQYIYIK